MKVFNISRFSTIALLLALTRRGYGAALHQHPAAELAGDAAAQFLRAAQSTTSSPKSEDEGVLEHVQDDLEHGMEDAEDKFEKEEDTFWKDLVNLPNKIRRVRHADGAWTKDLNDGMSSRMPNLKFTRAIAYSTLLIVSLAAAWFAYWCVYLYSTDRLDDEDDEGLERQASPRTTMRLGLDKLQGCDSEDHIKSPKMPQFDPPMDDKLQGIAEMDGDRSGVSSHFIQGVSQQQVEEFVDRVNPDFIIVLYHPNFADSADDSEIERKDLLKVIELDDESEQRDSLPGLFEMAMAEERASSGSLGGEPVTPKVKLGKARLAVLKDLHRLLHKLSFHVYVFSSIDNDEVFLCASLQDPRVIYHFIQREGNHIQLAQNIAKKIHVGQPHAAEDAAASPASISLDRRILDRLRQNGVDDLNRLDDLYSMDEFAPGSTLRIRHIYRELTRVFNTRRAQDLGLVSTWYPSHRRNQLQVLRRTWYDRSLILNMFKLPMQKLTSYYGERLAFMLVWNAHYCKMICALAVPSLLVELATVLSSTFRFHEETVRESCQLAFAFILVIWGAMAVRLWVRQQSFFQQAWNCEDLDEHAIPRPGFVGEKEPSPFDSFEQVKTPNSRSAFRCRMLSVVVTSLAALYVIWSVHAWFYISGGRLRLLGTVVLALQIKVYEFIFNAIAYQLTMWENHKYQTSHYNSWALKLFVFYFINYYYAFVHMLLLQRHSEDGCPPGGCLTAIKKQLIGTYSIVVLCGAINCLVADSTVRFKIWLEAYQLRKSREANGEAPNVEELSLVEMQAKFGEFNEKEQIETMIQLITSLGFLLLFGAVAPILVVPCFVVFAGYLKFMSYMLTYNTQRPFPWNLGGIGAWNYAINFLAGTGVLATACTLVQEGVFRGTSTLARLAGAMTFIIISLILRGLIEVILDDPDKETQLLAGRRKRVLKKIDQIVLDETIDEASVTKKKTLRRQSTQEAFSSLPTIGKCEDVDWNKLPNLRLAWTQS